MPDHNGRRQSLRAMLAASAFVLAAGGASPARASGEVVPDTFVCLLDGERIVIRFEPGEARMLLPGGDRATLYQIPAASGVRYSNGVLELRGKGSELHLVRHGNLILLTDCQPYRAPK